MASLIHKSSKLQVGDFIKIVMYVHQERNFFVSGLMNGLGVSLAPKKEVAIGKLERFSRHKQGITLTLESNLKSVKSSRGFHFPETCFLIRSRRGKEDSYAYILTKEEAVAELI